MPSPIGHALAGVIAAWTADLVPGDRRWRTAPATASWGARAGNGLTLACAALAAAADADLLLPTGLHRAFTHSVGAVLAVIIMAAAVTGWVTRKQTIVVRVALMCGAAYATHVLLDWMAVDDTWPYGIRALWPFSRAWSISGWDLFPGTARRALLSRASLLENARAFAWEIAILVPIAWLVWLVRVKALARLAAEMPRSHHPAE